MSDCVCFQDYIAELEVAHDEINRLRTALGYFMQYDDEKPMSWAYKREEAFRRANIIIGNSSDLGEEKK